MPKVAIFYHNDIDGLYSAACYMWIHKPSQPKLIPVQSAQRVEFDQMVEDHVNDGFRIVILDYAFNESAEFWCDHHYNSDFGDDTDNTPDTYFPEIAQDPVRIYSRDAKSATALMLGLLTRTVRKDSNGVTPYVDVSAVMHEVNMIDTAGFPDAKFVFENDSDIMTLMRHTDNVSTVTEEMNYILNTIVAHNMDTASVNRALKIKAETFIEDSKFKVKTAEMFLDKVDGTVFLYDIADNKRWIPRYTEYYIFPDCKYSVRAHPQMDGDDLLFKISVGANPWYKGDGELTDIGCFLSTNEYAISGGGHRGVGGCFIKAEDLFKFKAVILKEFK